MSLESDLVAYLKADTTIAGLVSGRVYSLVLPQAVVYPAISYQTVSLVEARDLSGPAGKARPRIQIDAWAETSAAARAVGRAINARINGFQGFMGSSRIGSVRRDNTFETFEEDAGESGVARVSQDFIIGHQED